ncbi:MAG: hypothetical protein ACRDP6_24565 [Actinoallomurus sp.]
MSDDTLFHVDTPAVEPTDLAGLTADQRRTVRQADALARGLHPLGLALKIGRYLAVHAEAAPSEDRTAPGRRCGNCRFRRNLAHQSTTHPKCVFGSNGDGAPRATHGAGTDVRGWWPACRDHEPGDPKLPDAMRWVPEPGAMR